MSFTSSLAIPMQRRKCEGFPPGETQVTLFDGLHEAGKGAIFSP
jgi:hypothetical protein